jgi:ABC-type multidrug transport system ATPase subunit
MVRRAGIVRSLLHEPDLWLLDEPFSGLDPEGQDLLEGVIRDFTAGGGTVMLVTHRTELGVRLASSQAWLRDGTTGAVGAAGNA